MQKIVPWKVGLWALWNSAVFLGLTASSLAASPVASDRSSQLFPESVRAWVDATGTYSVTATLTGFDREQGLVHFQRPNGSKASTALDRLCEADREYVEQFGAPRKAPKSAVVTRAASTTAATRLTYLQAPNDGGPGSRATPSTGYIYTGTRGTQAIDVNAKNGKALYRHLDDYVDATDLQHMWEDSNHYYFREVGKPGWYWQLAKRPTYRCCGCWWYCIGYRVTYVQDVGPNPPRVEFRYYARRDRIKGIDSYSAAAESVNAEAL